MSKRIFTRTSTSASASWLCPRCSARLSPTRVFQPSLTARPPHVRLSSQIRRYSDQSSPIQLPSALKSQLDSFLPSSNETLQEALRNDLKSAMRNKDKARLNVLRSVLADLKNVEKTSAKGDSGSDLAIRALLKKKISAADAAVKGFEDASRQDLADAEREQSRIMAEYVDRVRVMPRELVQQTIQSVYEVFQSESRNISPGSLMQALVGKDGLLSGRSVEKTTVSEVLQEFTKDKKS